MDELRQTEAVGVFTDLTEAGAGGFFGIELGPCFPVTYGRADGNSYPAFRRP